MKQFSSHFLTVCITILGLALISGNVISQDKPMGSDNTKYFYSDGTGNPFNLNLNKPVEQTISAERTALLSQIREARLSGNSELAKQLQAQLDGGQSVTSSPEDNDPNLTGILYTHQENPTKTPPFIETDYNVVTLSSSATWAVATQTSNRSPAIFAAVTEYVTGGGDLLKVYMSYNSGSTWVLKATFSGFVSTVDCRASELDIEPIISGSDTLLYCVTGYSYNTHAFTLIARCNVNTGAFTVTAWEFGGYSETSVNTYNPRITSDNTNYVGDSYVYISVAHDSTRSGGVHAYTQRFGVIQTPFSAITITYRNPINGTAGAQFYWGTSSTTGFYIFQDIAYINTGGDRIYSVLNFELAGINANLYTAWSNDYGVTNNGSLTLNRTYRVTGCRIAGNGGANPNAAICFVEDFSSSSTGDRDTRMLYTTTGGTTTGSFTLYNPEYTSDTSQSCDIQAVKTLNSVYKIAYQVRSGSVAGRMYYKGWTGSAPGTTYQYNNVPGDNSFGKIRAGYVRSNINDSCIAIWSPQGGSGAIVSYGCQSTVGINNNHNGTPNSYSLSQNYPNPFNPVTNIKFALPKSGFVKMVVYDMLGREAAVLVNENLNAGNYSVDFDASKLSSGVYFYKLSADGFTDVKKMMLIK